MAVVNAASAAQWHLNQRVRYWKGRRLHKISDGYSIFYAGVPDLRRQTCFSRRFHTCVVARKIACTHVDPQQECRSPHDDAKDRVRAKPPSQFADFFELCYSES